MTAPYPPVIVPLTPGGTYVQSSNRYGPLIRRGRSHKAPGTSTRYRGDYRINNYLSVSAQNRRYFGFAANLWRILLSPERKSAWRIWAHTHKITTETYAPSHLSAFQAYMFFAKLAMPWVYQRPQTADALIPSPPLLDPPPVYNPPILQAIQVIATTNLAGVFYAVYSPPLPGGSQQDVIVYATQPGSGGRLYQPALVQGGRAAPGHPTLSIPLYFGFQPYFGNPRFGERFKFGVRPYDAVNHVPGKLTTYDLITEDTYPP